MLKHIVFFRVLPESGGNERKANAQELKSRLEALPQHIPEIITLEAGIDISCSPASYDVSLYSEFKDAADLKTYQVHPKHQEVIEWVKANTSSRAVVDYWTE